MNNFLCKREKIQDKTNRASGIKIYLFLFVLSYFMFGCDSKDDESSIVFELTPEQPIIEANTGEIIIFHISVRSDVNLNRFTISQQDTQNGISAILDSVISTTSFNYNFEYAAPIFEDSTLLYIIFKVTDEQNNSRSLTRGVKIYGGGILLTETTGHILYSALANNLSAFNIDLLQPLSVVDNPDSLQHFADNSVDSINGPIISRSWKSPAGLKFVRFEGLSYPEATKTMMQNSYSYGIKLTTINDIQNDDVIIIGRDETALAVILIVQIIDDDWTDNDKYLFNLKK
jgi:hypothetical protein